MVSNEEFGLDGSRSLEESWSDGDRNAQIISQMAYLSFMESRGGETIYVPELRPGSDLILISTAPGMHPVAPRY